MESPQEFGRTGGEKKLKWIGNVCDGLGGYAVVVFLRPPKASKERMACIVIDVICFDPFETIIRCYSWVTLFTKRWRQWAETPYMGNIDDAWSLTSMHVKLLSDLIHICVRWPSQDGRIP
jgi:hypothetical protein